MQLDPLTVAVAICGIVTLFCIIWGISLDERIRGEMRHLFNLYGTHSIPRDEWIHDVPAGERKLLDALKKESGVVTVASAFSLAISAILLIALAIMTIVEKGTL